MPSLFPDPKAAQHAAAFRGEDGSAVGNGLVDLKIDFLGDGQNEYDTNHCWIPRAKLDGFGMHQPLLDFANEKPPQNSCICGCSLLQNICENGKSPLNNSCKFLQQGNTLDCPTCSECDFCIFLP